MSALGHSRPSYFVPVLNNVRYASDSDHSRYESELTLWATKRHLPLLGKPLLVEPAESARVAQRHLFGYERQIGDHGGDHFLPCGQLLEGILVRAHRSEIMFGVLVVILCPDRVAELSFSTGERQIPFIVSLRVLGALRLAVSGTRCPPLGTCSK
jgi:hypothetical protein